MPVVLAKSAHLLRHHPHSVSSAASLPPSDLRCLPSVPCRVFLDQATFSPAYNLFYFYVIGLMEGRSLQYIHDKISREFLLVMMMNYKVWPLVNVLNFKYVPANLRVLFGNIVGIFWTAYVIKLTK